MNKAIIENGKIISTTLWNTHIFEIVEKIPAGFQVWAIGENMGTDEYIPLCEDLHPEDKSNFDINRETLKAIKLSTDEVLALRKAAGWGINSKETAEKALRSKRKGNMSNRKRAEAEKTIDIFTRITE
jgi:hypothetical protein